MTHSQFLRLNPHGHKQHLPLHYSYLLSSTNDNDPVSQIFDQFCAADTLRGITDLFEQLCDAAAICPKDHAIFYQQLKKRLMSWRAQSLWSKLDKRASNSEYKSGRACNKTRVLVIGAGPCGLRVAIEMALLGAKAVVVEKRDSFSRNNVLHLWPFLIHDLKAVGAKMFFGKFCAGTIDHISILTLQCILLKVALLVGVEIHSGVSFEGFLEPQHNADDVESTDGGWRAKVIPNDHPVSEFIFDVCFSADGKRNTMTEFKRKELRGKFAIGITANFINRKTKTEAAVEEISGVSFIFNQKFFRDLYDDTGIDLENIVYYKDETHYFVMTAKKLSLLKKGVLKQDHDDLEMLLSKENLNHDSLLRYSREAADYSTNHELPSLDFAPNYSGQPDVDMFDFTSMFSSESACRVVERQGHLLLIGLVGDTLLEPFWPTGSGCARGFLGALDGAWMVRSWASGQMSPLEVIAERESIYQLLSQTKPDNLSRNYANYTIDPSTRYTNLQMHTYKPYQAESLYDGEGDRSGVICLSKQKNLLYGSLSRNWNLLRWFQKELESYENLVTVVEFSKSWQSGLALCALIHHHWPHLIDVFALDPKDAEYNNQLAFDILNEHCKIFPPATGHHMAQANIPEEKMVNFLLLVQDYFKRKSRENKKANAVLNEKKSSRSVGSLNEVLVDRGSNAENIDKSGNVENNSASLKSNQFNPEGVIRTLKRIRDIEAGQNAMNVKTSKSSELEDILNRQRYDNSTEAKSLIWKETKVSALARDLALKFKGEYVYDDDKKQNTDLISPEKQQLRDVCRFCKERVYVADRCIAEGQLLHRQCFRCEYCHSLLDVNSFSIEKNDEGMDIFCHPRCHSTQMRKKENPMRQFNSHSSWAPVDRATFESTRKILLRQSQMKRSHGSKSKSKSTAVNEWTFPGATGYDDEFKSSTEQELCFSDDSDSEKPDLSWDGIMKSADEKIRLSYVVKDSSANRQQITVERIDDDRGSDADCEADTSDSHTDIPSSDMSCDDRNRIIRLSRTFGKNKMAAATDEVLEKKHLKQEQESRLRNRMAFFGSVAEPVRINARQFLGLDQQITSSAVSKESTDDVKNSEKENAEPAEKSISQNENEEEKPEFIEDKKADSSSVISKRQLKRKKKIKTKKKHLLRARKQGHGEKTNEKLSETAITSSALVRERQTVAVIPLSEDSSSSGDLSDDGSTKDPLDRERCVHLKSVSQHQSSAEERNERSSVDPCLASDASIDVQQSEQTAEINVLARTTDGQPDAVTQSHVTDEQFSDSETKAPRPGLLMAEAMFSSYGESAVVTAISGQENSFTSSSDNDDKADILAPNRDDGDHQYVGEDGKEELVAPCRRLLLSYSEVKKKDSEMGNCLQRSRSIGLLYEQLTFRQYDHVGERIDPKKSVFVDLKNDSAMINDNYSSHLIETQNESISSETADCSLADIASLIHEDVQVTEALVCTGTGLDFQYIDNKHDDGCDDGENFSTDYHCEIRHDDGEKRQDGSDQQSVSTKLGDNDLRQITNKGKTEKMIGKCLEIKRPPRAKIESFSDDELELSSRLSQVTLSDGNDDIQRHASRENLETDKDFLLQLSGLNVGDNLEFIEDRMHTDFVDPVSRLDQLLNSLSSKNCLASDSVASNSPVSLNAAFDVNNCSGSDVLSVQPTEQQQQKKLHSESKNKSENIKDGGKHVIKEKPAVDENVNYIHSSLVRLQENAANEEFKLESNSLSLSKCMCMNEVENDQTLENKLSGSSFTETKYSEDVAEKKREPNLELRGIECNDANRSTVSAVSLLDAKRKFFQQVAQPVRINPLSIFKSDLPPTQNYVSEEKPCEAILPQSGSTSNSLVNCKAPDGKKQTELSRVQIKDDKKLKRQLLLTTSTNQLPFGVSTKTDSLLQTGVLDLGQLVKANPLSLSEGEINRKALIVAEQCVPSSVLLSSSDISISMNSNQKPSVAERCASLPNVQHSRAVDKNEKDLSHIFAENLRLDNTDLDKMKAGSSSIIEFKNSETDVETVKTHSISSEIPNCIDELIEQESQPTG